MFIPDESFFNTLITVKPGENESLVQDVDKNITQGLVKIRKLKI
jgi:hypothetical protein